MFLSETLFFRQDSRKCQMTNSQEQPTWPAVAFVSSGLLIGETVKKYEEIEKREVFWSDSCFS